MTGQKGVDGSLFCDAGFGGVTETGAEFTGRASCAQPCSFSLWPVQLL